MVLSKPYLPIGGMPEGIFYTQSSSQVIATLTYASFLLQEMSNSKVNSLFDLFYLKKSHWD